jgi:superfamily II DNA/RNA helicase
VNYVKAPGSFVCADSLQHYYTMVTDDTPRAKVNALREIIRANPNRSETVGLLLFEQEQDQQTYLRLLTNVPALTVSQLSVTTPIRLPGYMHLIVANFRQIRGLHLPGNLRYLFLADVPHSESEYLHMAGRIGRLSPDGRSHLPGSVITLVTMSQLSKLKSFTSTLQIDFEPLADTDATTRDTREADRSARTATAAAAATPLTSSVEATDPPGPLAEET